MRLVSQEGTPLKIGDKVVTFRGESATLRAMIKPHKPSSTGRVYLKFDDDLTAGEYFPSVINARWEEEGAEK